MECKRIIDIGERPRNPGHVVRIDEEGRAGTEELRQHRRSTARYAGVGGRILRMGRRHDQRRPVGIAVAKLYCRNRPPEDEVVLRVEATGWWSQTWQR